MPWLALLGRFWYVVPIVGFAAAATYYHVRFDRSVAAHEAYVAARDVRELRAADAAIAAQKALRDAAEARNIAILGKFNDATNNLANSKRDLDLANRLLSAARAAAISGAVPEADRGQSAARTSGAPSDGRLSEAVAATLTECRRNADRLDAVIAEIEPQIF